MNTKYTAIAFALAACTAFASSLQAAETITLETVQVRPSTDQLAQARHERNSHIPTLATVQVRPTVGQTVELMAGQAATRLAAHTPAAIGARIGQWSISVRPGLQQAQARAADLAAEAAAKATVQGLPNR